VTSLAAVLSPLQLGQLTLRNRVVSTSHQTRSYTTTFRPTNSWRIRGARSGTGLIVLEATARIRKTSRHPT
jgi:2,4-dienoyl-CoA reductase-like NADH-dependent reductase (Old Yellow Enzyme family)